MIETWQANAHGKYAHPDDVQEKLVESGFKGFDAQQWYGVVGPAGLPPEVSKVLNDSLAQVLAAPDLREKLSVEAIEPTIMTSAQFGAFIRADVARWTQLARERKIELD